MKSYTDMIVRKIEKEDLPVIAKLAKDKSLETRDDICFKYSKICLSDDGEVLCFILLKEHSLIDFFNGEIPADENTEYDEDYEEGDEWWVKESIENNENHYEVIAMYSVETNEVPFNHTIAKIQDKVVFWTSSTPYFEHYFYHFNNKVWINFPMEPY